VDFAALCGAEDVPPVSPQAAIETTIIRAAANAKPFLSFIIVFLLRFY
jgi:hypothetical protein